MRDGGKAENALLAVAPRIRAAGVKPVDGGHDPRQPGEDRASPRIASPPLSPRSCARAPARSRPTAHGLEGRRIIKPS